MLKILKEEQKVPPETKISDIRLREVIKLYGPARFKKEVKEKHLDIPVDFI